MMFLISKKFKKSPLEKNNSKILIKMKTIGKNQVGYFEVMNEVVQNSTTHMEEGMYSPSGEDVHSKCVH
jgi:hypothetical protein